MKEFNTELEINDIISLFNGEHEFIIVRKGETMNNDDDVFVGKEVGTTSDPYTARVCDDSNVRIVGGNGAGPVYGGWKWHEINGTQAYNYNKSENPQIFLYEATNKKSGEKIVFNGKNLTIQDIWRSNFFKVSHKIKNGYKVTEFLTQGKIDGEQVEVRIIPRIVKLSDEEIEEKSRKARRRKENTINRLKTEIEAEKQRIKYAEDNIAKLQEKLEKLLFPKTSSDWLKNVYSKSNGILFDIKYLKDGIPDLKNKDDKETAKHLIDAIMKYEVGQHDAELEEIKTLISTYKGGGLRNKYEGCPNPSAGDIAYYVSKKMGILTPELKDGREKWEWFTQSILDDVNLHDTSGTNTTSYHDNLYYWDPTKKD